MPLNRHLLVIALTLLLPVMAGAEAPARVRVVLPEVADFGERFSVSGSLSAERAAELSPRVDGLVAEVLVDAGNVVEAGQVLLRLDPALARQSLLRLGAQAEQAAVAAVEAERLLAETRRLVEQQFVPSTQVDTRLAELAQARAALASARAAEREQAELVERHQLPAPFAGVISAKRAEAGEWVQRGTPVFSLVAIDRLRIDLQVPQERYGQIDEDAEIIIHPDVGDGGALRGQIRTKLPVTDPTARTFLLRVTVDDPERTLLPGTSVRAEIALPVRESALSVSRDALLRQPDGSFSLFVVETEDGRLVARQRGVRVLRDQGTMVAVASGLAAGERVVVRGNEALRDGQAVELTEN